MNNKAAGALMITAAAFLIAVVLFYNLADKQKPGESARYLGQTEVTIFGTYSDAEKQLLYIDIAAENSFKAALKEVLPNKASLKDAYNKDLLANFTSRFSVYLQDFNRIYGTKLAMGDYAITVDDNGAKGICAKELNITTELVDYHFKPSFRTFGAPTTEAPAQKG